MTGVLILVKSQVTCRGTNNHGQALFELIMYFFSLLNLSKHVSSIFFLVLHVLKCDILRVVLDLM